MNLHEECLLKYLLNPLDLLHSTELLKLNNSLIEKGILSKVEEYGVKILGNGKLEKALTVKANKFSESALKKIKKAGGTIEEV